MKRFSLVLFFAIISAAVSWAEGPQLLFDYALSPDLESSSASIATSNEIHLREFNALNRVLQNDAATYPEVLKGSAFGSLALDFLQIRSDSSFVHFVSTQENNLRFHYSIGQSFLVWKLDSPGRLVWKFNSSDNNAQHTTGFGPAELNLDGIRKVRLQFRW